MSVRLWLLGYDLLIAPQVVVRHRFRASSPYPVGWPQYLHNRLRLAFAHLSAPRLAKAVRALQKMRHSAKPWRCWWRAISPHRRREMLARRVRSDDWYFERFGLRW